MIDIAIKNNQFTKLGFHKTLADFFRAAVQVYSFDLFPRNKTFAYSHLMKGQCSFEKICIDVEEFEEKKISEEEYILSGRLELDYLNQKYGLEFPDTESETLSGFIIHQHETIPKLKERIFINDFEFEILNVSDTRIEMVRLKII